MMLLHNTGWKNDQHLPFTQSGSVFHMSWRNNEHIYKNQLHTVTGRPRHEDYTSPNI